MKTKPLDTPPENPNPTQEPWTLIENRPETPFTGSYRQILAGAGFFGEYRAGAVEQSMGFSLSGYMSKADADLIVAAPKTAKECDRLKKANAALVTALKRLVPRPRRDSDEEEEALALGRAAIAEAEETTTEDMPCPSCGAIMPQRFSGIGCNRCGYFDCL